MRWDERGLFWEDEPMGASRSTWIPPIPIVDWKPPTEFPNLNGVKIISLDTETCDINLKKRGAGWARHDGHIVGVSLCTEDNHAWYFPTKHSLQTEMNMCPDKVKLFLEDTLEQPSLKKIIGANLTYDIGWLWEEGIYPRAELFDVIFAESILSPGKNTKLDDIAFQYLGLGKETNELYQWIRLAYGDSGDPRQHIHKSPVSLVGKYAEQDAYLPFKIHELQMQRFNEDEELYNVYRLECRLIYLMLCMRFNGVKVDLDKANILRNKLNEEIKNTEEKLKYKYGFTPNVNSSRDLAKVFSKENIPFMYTSKGNPSFAKDYLKSVEHPLAHDVLKIKQHKKLISTFIEGGIFKSHVNGKLYTSFNQLKIDEVGAITGRFSSSNPNLQNIPNADSDLGKMMRSIFVPEGVQWRKFDYSQIEYRCLVHFAVGNGADEMRNTYVENPFTDYHRAVQIMVKEKTGKEISRKITKNVNFGLIYGMGESTLSNSIGMTKEQVKEFLEAYHGAIPFAKGTMKFYSDYANTHGEIRTILGRRTLFEEFVPDVFERGRIFTPVPFSQAKVIYAGMPLKRFGLHKSLNYLLQGSASDIIKIAMLQMYENGLFKNTGVPTLQVHDELNFNDIGGIDNDFKLIKECMEDCVKLRVPIVADEERGLNWGETTEVENVKL